MYERPDVPKDNPNRNKIAVVVLVAIALGIFILGSTLWRLANVHSALGSKDVSRAVASATVSDESAQQLAEASGLTLTGDDVECVLFAVVPSGDSSELAGAYLASIDATAQSAKLVSLPVSASLPKGDATATLAQLYGDGGLASLASSLSLGCSVPVSHAVVMTQDGWSAFLDAAAQGSSALKRNATKLMGGIVKSDLDATGLLDVATKALSMGVSAEDIAEAGTVEDGSLDAAGLASLVGVLA